jgi:anaerobic ribonucleoside-triphosphate reductase activating protein
MTEGRIDGITITGGEPFEQSCSLGALLDALEEWRATDGFDILCYSGFPLKRLELEHAQLLDRLDALIPEPFVLGSPSLCAWQGSDNQPLIVLSALGKERYSTIPTGPPSIQVDVTDGAIWFIGIPRPGDMDRVQALAKQRGLIMEKLSWRI